MWRTVAEWPTNGLNVKVQVSPARRIRFATWFGDSLAAISSELNPEDAGSWLTNAKPKIASASASELILPDALLIAPYPSVSDFRAYSVTLADTSGKWVATRSNPAEILLLISGIEDAALAARIFTDAELRRDDPIVRTGAEVLGDRPIFYPSDECLEGKGVVQLSFEVDSTGTVGFGSIRIDKAPDGAFARVAEVNLVQMRFKPATLEGHRIKAWMTHSFALSPPHANAVTVVSSTDLNLGVLPAASMGARKSLQCGRY
jgi:hypothetical protein